MLARRNPTPARPHQDGGPKAKSRGGRPGPAFHETCTEPRQGSREMEPEPELARLSGPQARATEAVLLTLFMVPVSPPARSPPTFPSGVQGSPSVTSLKPQLWLEAAGVFRGSFNSQAAEHGPAEPPQPSRQHAAPAAAASEPGRGLSTREAWRALASEEGSGLPGSHLRAWRGRLGQGATAGGSGGRHQLCPPHGPPGKKSRAGCGRAFARRGWDTPAGEGAAPTGHGASGGVRRHHKEASLSPGASTPSPQPSGTPSERGPPSAAHTDCPSPPAAAPSRALTDLPLLRGRLHHRSSVPRAGAPGENTVAPAGRRVPEQ